jgi:pSer/pThr/pTyr-binding forkhead associated (FHA) protein
MVMPAMTMPVSGEGAVPTVFASKDSGGALSPAKRYALVVLSGKEPGKVIPIDKARVTIGRSDCDVVLDDTELSRQHALIAINGTRARLQDLGSTNGTYVGESRVDQAALEDRSEFRIGTHELLFVMTDREGPLPAAGQGS